ncbi:MAG: hypothetical protein JKX76_00475 [Colwellia sp.]|nr:hypothetical protein [Colwellia sp.]
MSCCHTPKDAAKNLTCPLARTFGTDKLTANCRGGDCAAWRWRQPLSMPPEFMTAIKREMACLANEEQERTGKKVQADKHHKKAVTNVSHDPEAYGVPMPKDKGWCGLGGQPG